MRRLLLGLTALAGLFLVGNAQASDWSRGERDRGHYHYVPGHYDRHGNHYDYHPGHYEYHRGRDTYSPGRDGYGHDRGYSGYRGYSPDRGYQAPGHRYR